MAALTSTCAKVPVTSLTALMSAEGRQFVLIGQGHHLLLAADSNKTVLDQLEVFRGANVHDIVSIGNSNEFLVIGGKSVAKVALENNKKLTVICKEKILPDWAWSSCTIDAADGSSLHCFLTAHNRLLVTNSQLDVIRSFGSEEKCILYSGHLLTNNGSDVIVFGGSVFSQVLIWSLESVESEKGNDMPVDHRLSGHEGVIFSVRVCLKANLICTTSDDRSARLWAINFPPTIKPGPQQWRDASIELVHTLYGHTARVFSSIMIKEHVITVGEDSRICLWSLRNGTLKDKIEQAHSGAPVWSMAALPESASHRIDPSSSISLVTGGGDAGVSLWSLPLNPTAATLANPWQESDHPKLVFSLDRRLFVVSDQGSIYMLDDSALSLCHIHAEPSLAGYCVVSVNAGTSTVALAGLNGQVILFRLLDDDLRLVGRQKVADGKIFSIGLLDTVLVVNLADGVLKGFSWSVTEVEQWARWESDGLLPPVKQRWFSTSVEWSNHVVLGDRCGGVHFYCNKTESNQLDPVTSFHKIHGRNGVTHLLCFREDLLSCGRDGTVRRYAVGTDGSIIMLSVIQLTADWVARLLPVQRSILAVVFHGSVLRIQDVAMGQETLCEFVCGGGHRSWDMTSHGVLAYIKEKQVVTEKVNLNQHNRQILQGIHSQQINAIAAFRLGDTMFVCTAGEDTLIRIHKMDTGHRYRSSSLGDRATLELSECVAVLRGHVSSIKSLSVLATGSTSILLLSSGGRAQLKMWEVVMRGADIVARELASHMLLGDDKAVKRPWRKTGSISRHNPETRFLDVSVNPEDVNTTSAEAANCRQVGFLVACSDGLVREFCFADQAFKLCGEYEFQDHCVQLITQTRLPGHKILVLAFATSGYVHYWRKSDFSNEENAHRFDGLEGSERLHQSGINSVDIDVSSGGCTIATGGDDNALVVSSLRIRSDDRIELTRLWHQPSAHAAQITAVKFTGTSIISASIDQRICIWKSVEKKEYGKNCETNADRSNSWEFFSSKCCSVADVQTAVFQPTANELAIIVAGIGMELLSLPTVGHQL